MVVLPLYMQKLEYLPPIWSKSGYYLMHILAGRHLGHSGVNL